MLRTSMDLRGVLALRDDTPLTSRFPLARRATALEGRISAEGPRRPLLSFVYVCGSIDVTRCAGQSPEATNPAAAYSSSITGGWNPDGTDMLKQNYNFALVAVEASEELSLGAVGGQRSLSARTDQRPDTREHADVRLQRKAG
jgi:hypothetical protein